MSGWYLWVGFVLISFVAGWVFCIGWTIVTDELDRKREERGMTTREKLARYLEKRYGIWDGLNSPVQFWFDEADRIIKLLKGGK